MQRFQDRTALVTAAASGLGWACAWRLAHEGATVVVWDIAEERLAAAQAEAAAAKVNMLFRSLDLTDPAALAEAADSTLEALGRIDILVNNIGGSLHTPYRFLELNEEHWRQVMDINVTACVRITRLLLPSMIDHGYGRIINMGSKAGRFGSLFAGANYVAAKGAVQALTLQLAQEFGPHGITCNAVCPGAIMTPRVQGLIAERQSPEERERVLLGIPVRRHGRVEDVAAAVAFLASGEAGFITGVMLDVNGGQCMSI